LSSVIELASRVHHYEERGAIAVRANGSAARNCSANLTFQQSIHLQRNLIGKPASRQNPHKFITKSHFGTSGSIFAYQVHTIIPRKSRERSAVPLFKNWRAILTPGLVQSDGCDLAIHAAYVHALAARSSPRLHWSNACFYVDPPLAANVNIWVLRRWEDVALGLGAVLAEEQKTLKVMRSVGLLQARRHN